MLPRFKHRQLDQNAVPTTSLADMMFLLLIFFIMTTTLTRITGFVTDIPSGAKGQAAAQEKTPTVALHDGKITVNDHDMSKEEMRKYITELRLDQKTGDAKVVIVSSTGRVGYQDYYETMAMIQTAGGIVAMIQEEESGKP